MYVAKRLNPNYDKKAQIRKLGDNIMYCLKYMQIN